MTIKEFMNLFDLKNESTVIKWIKDGYIQGAYRDEKANEYLFPILHVHHIQKQELKLQMPFTKVWLKLV